MDSKKNVKEKVTLKADERSVVGKKVNSLKKWEVHSEVGEVESEDYVIGKVSSRGLAPLDWQKLMVAAIEEIAMNLEANSVSIQSAENNKWAGIRDSSKKWHLDKKVAQNTYDKTAQRLGFSLNPDDGNWHKSIASQ